ncbi:MAG: metallophosphoesterase family protein [Candidatus Hydrogenedentes bacterium]|nr:metallophosphoesterase family protein [Candidatus Hydrogenedentota bacterium]
MIAAVLGAVEGNVSALGAALDHISHLGIHTVFQTGHLAVGGPAPNEVTERLRVSDIPAVQGEMDRQLLRYARKPDAWRNRLVREGERPRGPVRANLIADFEAALAALTTENLEWLNRLPRRLELAIDGAQFFVCHGSPASQSELLSPGTPLQRLERLREMAPVDVLICGGVAETFERHLGNTLLVCPGPLMTATGAAHFVLVSTESGTPRMQSVMVSP